MEEKERTEAHLGQWSTSLGLSGWAGSPRTATEMQLRNPACLPRVSLRPKPLPSLILAASPVMARPRGGHSQPCHSFLLSEA